MLKKTIEYTDYNGVTRKEDFYFNLSKAELTEMQLTTKGGFAEMIEKIIETKDQASMIKIFKDLIFKAYGEKSEDGKRFIKSQEISEAFSQTEAYSILFMELASNDKEASAFINGVVPSDLAKAMNEQDLKLPSGKTLETFKNENNL